MKFNFKGIKFKLWLYLTLFAISIMTVLWFFQTVFLQPYYESGRRSDLKAAAARIIESKDSADLQSELENIAYKYNASALIIDKSDNILYSANMIGLRNPFESSQTADSMPPPQNNDRPDLKDLSALFDKYIVKLQQEPSGVLVTKVENNRFRSNTLLYATYIGDNYLLLNAELQPVDTTIMILRRQLILVTLLVLLFASIISIFIARSITRPITDINSASKNLASRRFPAECTGGAYTETRELAHTLKHTSEELSQVENLRREFIANVSHDLRTPLTMIKAYSEAVRDLPPENAQRTYDDLTIVINESNRLSSLVDDLLEVSRMQSGSITINPTVFNLTQLINAALTSYKIYCDRDGYDIQFEYESEVWIKADSNRISQALHNLIINAINHSKNSKLITVKQIVLPDAVRVEVCDRGPGISENVISNIWDRYYNNGKRPDGFSGGSGLGLAIVKSIMEQHNARFGVISKLGVGSTFWFELKK